jgi:cytochrome c-type biogenesis protein CcmH/NrfG
MGKGLFTGRSYASPWKGLSGPGWLPIALREARSASRPSGSMPMRSVTARSILIASLAFALAGCQTDGSFNLFSSSEQPAPVVQTAAFDEPPPPVQAEEAPPVHDNLANNTARGEVLRGNNPADDIKLGKKHYREQNFGLAERHFRRAVEAAPNNAEAWMGLAASYDRLRRFDLADRAYSQALAIVGPTPELLNNHGYSYILRGDYKNARIKLASAKAKAPGNKYVQNNIDLLEDSIRNAR